MLGDPAGELAGLAARARRCRAKCRSDRGNSTLEVAVLFPVMLLLIFGVIQLALHFYARNVAAGAASEGVVAGSVLAGSSGVALRAADDFVAAAGSGMLTDTHVTVARSTTTITVTVTGQAMNLLPGIHLPAISQTVSGPVERTTDN